GQTQPTMGRRLRALDSAVGHTHFQRTAYGFVLTDECTAILVHAERIEAEALALQRLLTVQQARLYGCKPWLVFAARDRIRAVSSQCAVPCGIPALASLCVMGAAKRCTFL